LPIGSGEVEADCKVLAQARCKHSGMPWSKRGAEQLRRARCALRNGSFHPLWEHRRESITLLPKTPGRTAAEESGLKYHSNAAAPLFLQGAFWYSVCCQWEENAPRQVAAGFLTVSSHVLLLPVETGRAAVRRRKPLFQKANKGFRIVMGPRGGRQSLRRNGERGRVGEPAWP